MSCEDFQICYRYGFEDEYYTTSQPGNDRHRASGVNKPEARAQASAFTFATTTLRICDITMPTHSPLYKDIQDEAVN